MQYAFGPLLQQPLAQTQALGDSGQTRRKARPMLQPESKVEDDTRSAHLFLITLDELVAVRIEFADDQTFAVDSTSRNGAHKNLNGRYGR